MKDNAIKSNKIILGHDRGTGAEEILHVGDDGRFLMEDGDWLWGAFKRSSKHLARKNGFSREEQASMEAIAICCVLKSKNGYSPSKGSYKSYLNTVVGNALREAARQVADERSVWNSYQSLDTPLGEDGEGATYVERVLDGAGFASNAKIWGEPRCRVVRRLLREHKEDGRAKHALLKRLAEEEAPGTKRQVSSADLTGYGDSAAALYELVLHYDVAFVMQGLEPKLRSWCERVLEGHSAKEASDDVGFSKFEWYACARPALRAAFAHLRYALEPSRKKFAHRAY